MYSLDVWQDGEWNHYALKMDGEVVATARWRKMGWYAELHNEVLRSSPSVIKQCRQTFDVIKQDVKAAGCIGIATQATDYDDKLAKYWRLMGFKCFFAAMEV